MLTILIFSRSLYSRRIKFQLAIKSIGQEGREMRVARITFSTRDCLLIADGRSENTFSASRPAVNRVIKYTRRTALLRDIIRPADS